MSKKIRVALIGIGSVAAGLIEGLAYYKKQNTKEGLIFPNICGYELNDIKIVAGFDVFKNKIKLLSTAIYAPQNIFVKNNLIDMDDVKKVVEGEVYPGKRLDGVDSRYVKKVSQFSKEFKYSDEKEILKNIENNDVEVIINLLPTGASNASEFYSKLALSANCAFINAIPSPIFKNNNIREAFIKNKIPLFGDDIKSQVGATMMHRAILNAITSRGGKINCTTQRNDGGNMDFYNLEKRNEEKKKTKIHSLSSFVKKENITYNVNYDELKNGLKYAYIDVSATIFGNSPLIFNALLIVNDKPNAAACLVDLIMLGKAFLENKIELNEKNLNLVSSFYMKSPIKQIDEYRSKNELEKLINRKQY
ncbi:MAG: hypothetical protein CVU81_00430 [Euryarchaeota archaeon HGW-Euryarchaeota-1]|nr:MAG: hypothetical protein CVU81_00430 [Euryarchaeota archaeon HGW-Euryarchaeota-1]